MDRRRFIATVGVASAAAAAATALEPDWAHADPSVGPGPRVPEQVDKRFLDVLTTVNNLQIPGVLSAYQEQIDSLASPRALAQSALRLVSAYANPRGQHYHDAALARTAADPADRPRGAPEPQRSVRHRQPGQPARHLVRDQRSGTGLRPAGRRRPARHRRRAAGVRDDHASGRGARWPKAAYTPRTIAGRSARRSPTCTTCGRAGCCWRGSTTGWARASIKTARASTASAVPTTPPRSPTARCSSWRGTRTSHGCWTTCAATSNSPSTGSSPTARWRRCSRAGRIRPAFRMCGST